VGEISAAIQTLLSMTSRSTFIREHRVQRTLVHSMRGGVFAGALHGLTNALARNALPTGVAFGRNHHHRGSAISGDADGLTLSGFHHFAKPVLGFQGGHAFHGGHNSCYGRNRQN
jgi:hypothetical protein